PVREHPSRNRRNGGKIGFFVLLDDHRRPPSDPAQGGNPTCVQRVHGGSGAYQLTSPRGLHGDSRLSPPSDRAAGHDVPVRWDIDGLPTLRCPTRHALPSAKPEGWRTSTLAALRSQAGASPQNFGYRRGARKSEVTVTQATEEVPETRASLREYASRQRKRYAQATTRPQTRAILDEV